MSCSGHLAKTLLNYPSEMFLGICCPHVTAGYLQALSNNPGLLPIPPPPPPLCCFVLVVWLYLPLCFLPWFQILSFPLWEINFSYCSNLIVELFNLERWFDLCCWWRCLFGRFLLLHVSILILLAVTDFSFTKSL